MSAFGKWLTLFGIRVSHWGLAITHVDLILSAEARGVEPDRLR